MSASRRLGVGRQMNAFPGAHIRITPFTHPSIAKISFTKLISKNNLNQSFLGEKCLKSAQITLLSEILSLEISISVWFLEGNRRKPQLGSQRKTLMKNVGRFKVTN